MMNRKILSMGLAIALFIFSAFNSVADGWKVVKLKAQPSNQLITKNNQTPNNKPDGLPDGLVTHNPNKDIVSSAWYADPTNRYAHGILGDAVEAGALKVKTKNGKTLKFTLPKSEVFEDRYPRLSDLDGDGTTEIITIKSSTKLGAAVAMFGVVDGKLIQKAATKFIGKSNRWLNIAGISRFRGGKAKQIAYVKTPHIGGTLYFIEYDGKRLKQVASMAGFSNHEIGSREMRLSALYDINNDGAMDLVLPSADRRQLRFVGFVKNKLRDFGHAFLPSQIDKQIIVRQFKASTSFVVGLRNGELFEVYK